MLEEIKIIISIIKKNIILIFILPFILSVLIYFYIQNFYNSSIELKRYHVYTDTVNRQSSPELDDIISKFKKANSAYNSNYLLNEKIFNELNKKELIILSKTFREFFDLLLLDDEMMRGLKRIDLNVNDLTRNQFYSINFNKEDLSRLKIDFHSNNNDKEIIFKIFNDAINYINSSYSKKIFEARKMTFFLIKKDFELAIKMNDDLIKTKKKQIYYENKNKSSNLNNYLNQKKVDIDLEIIFFEGYKDILIEIITDIDDFILSKDIRKTKLFNNVSKVEDLSETKINYILKYLYIFSYFLFSTLFLVFAIIYEYNFKRKK
tara:strand:- start:7576 stop:8535 length:960 start_codon:yes stop_codon:yes gene_type:complete